MTLDVKNIHLVVFLVGIAGLKNPIGNPLFYEPIPTTFPLKLATLLNNPLQKFPFSNKSPPLKIPPLTLTTHAPHLFPEQNLENEMWKYPHHSRISKCVLDDVYEIVSFSYQSYMFCTQYS